MLLITQHLILRHIHSFKISIFQLNNCYCFFLINSPAQLISYTMKLLVGYTLTFLNDALFPSKSVQRAILRQVLQSSTQKMKQELMHNGNEWLSPNVVGTNRVSNLQSICRNGPSLSLVCRKLLRIVALFIPRQYVRPCQKCLLRTENLGVHLLCCCPSVTRVAVRWRIVGDMTGWLGSSVVESSHGQRKALCSSPGRATMFHLLQMAPNVIFIFFV